MKLSALVVALCFSTSACFAKKDLWMEADAKLGQTIEIRDLHVQECLHHDDDWGIMDSAGKIKPIPLYGSAGINAKGQIAAKLLSSDRKLAVRKLIGPQGKILPDSNSVEVVNFMIDNRVPVRVLASGPSKNRTMQAEQSTFSYCTETGQVLQCRFDQVSPFCNGVAAVRTGNQVGFIGLDGKFLSNSKRVECQFLKGISEGCLAAKFNGLWGYLDSSGNWIIEPQFDEAQPFSDGLAIVRVHGKSGENSEGITYVDKTGKIFGRCFYSGKPFENGYAAASTLTSKTARNTLWGLIDKSGKWVAEPKYTRIGELVDSTRLVYDNKLVGIFSDGKIVVPPKYAKIGEFSEGLAAFQADAHSKFGFLDRYGKIVIPAKFPFAGTFSEGLAAVTIVAPKSGEYKIGFVDKYGKMTIEPMFGRSGSIGPEFNRDFVQFHEGVCLIPDRPYHSGKDTKYGSGYIDKLGRWIDKHVITLAYPFQDGQALVRYYPKSDR